MASRAVCQILQRRKSIMINSPLIKLTLLTFTHWWWWRWWRRCLSHKTTTNCQLLI